MSPMSRGRALVILLAVTVVAGICALFVSMPLPVLRTMAGLVAPSIMKGGSTTEGGVRVATARLAGAYVNSSLAAHVADRVTAGAASDEEALFRIVATVRDHVLTQNQFDHIPRAWPVLVSGVGYCDQINGAVAIIAARRFQHAQLYAAYDRRLMTTPHTVGRVWSSQRKEWLYFDAYYEEPLLYTKAADGTPRFLQTGAAKRIAARGKPDIASYALPGWVIAEFKPTFGAYLWNRVATRVTPASAAVTRTEAAPVLSALGTFPPAAIPDKTRFDDRVFAKISADFVDARIADLLGEPSTDAYRRISTDATATRDERAEYVAEIAGRLADAQ